MNGGLKNTNFSLSPNKIHGAAQVNECMHFFPCTHYIVLLLILYTTESETGISLFFTSGLEWLLFHFYVRSIKEVIVLVIDTVAF